MATTPTVSISMVFLLIVYVNNKCVIYSCLTACRTVEKWPSSTEHVTQFIQKEKNAATSILFGNLSVLPFYAVLIPTETTPLSHGDKETGRRHCSTVPHTNFRRRHTRRPPLTRPSPPPFPLPGSLLCFFYDIIETA